MVNVKFCYPTRPDTVILNDFMLDVESGKATALVGASGSGKSTVIQLIERFYDVGSGILSIDGVEIKDFDLNWLREQIGLVSQEPILFSCSIEENIRYGKEDASDDEVVAAARAANAHDFIQSFPKGYKTLVGERGTQLSGGQKQRVAIARAVLKNPKILLLDEATSALDTESERLVQDALDKLMQHRTSIIIAHRLSTIQNCDKIVVINKGNVVEQGSHDELLRLNAAYAHLVSRQMGDHGEHDDKLVIRQDTTLFDRPHSYKGKEKVGSDIKQPEVKMSEPENIIDNIIEDEKEIKKKEKKEKKDKKKHKSNDGE